MKIFFENLTCFICIVPIALGYLGIITFAIGAIAGGFIYPLVLLLRPLWIHFANLKTRDDLKLYENLKTTLKTADWKVERDHLDSLSRAHSPREDIWMLERNKVG